MDGKFLGGEVQGGESQAMTRGEYLDRDFVSSKCHPIISVSLSIRADEWCFLVVRTIQSNNQHAVMLFSLKRYFPALPLGM